MEQFSTLSHSLIAEIKENGYFSDFIQLVNKDLASVNFKTVLTDETSVDELLFQLENSIKEHNELAGIIKQLCYRVDLPEHIYHSYTRHPLEEFNFFIHHLLKRWYLKLVYRIKHKD